MEKYNKKIQDDYVRLEKKFRNLTAYVMEISREYDYFFKNFADVLLKKQLEIENLKKDKAINYKQQLERLKLQIKGWRANKILGNTFNEFDRGHREATIKCANDFIEVVNLALKGKIE